MISISGVKAWLFPKKETIGNDEDIGTSALLEALDELRARVKARNQGIANKA